MDANTESASLGESEKPEYLIWAACPTVARIVQGTERAIREIVGSELELMPVKIANDVVTFWGAPLTDSQRERIEALEGVRRVERNEQLDVDYGVFEDADEQGDGEVAPERGDESSKF